jgi:hypothetical protein
MKILLSILCLLFLSLGVHAQTLKLKNQEFELHNVTGEVVKFQGKKALKIERDLTAIPFDSTRLEATVDEPHYARLLGLEDFENGTIEVKLYSELQNPAPYSGIAGFIGLFFRVQEDDSAFESIYVRPKVGRSDNQLHRNHAVQYFSYPDYKFDTLRKIAPHRYEGSAPVALNEWFTMRIEVNGKTAELFINDLKYSSFIVDKMLGTSKKGFVGLYVDIGTIGYFRDLKVTKRAYQEKKAGDEVSDI